MKRLIGKKFVLRRNMMAVVGICLSFYFSYHLIAGQRGYLSLISLNHQIENLETAHQAHKEQREAIEKKVVMMRPGSIDRDLLEERARYVLGFRYQDELILLNKSPDSRS